MINKKFIFFAMCVFIFLSFINPSDSLSAVALDVDSSSTVDATDGVLILRRLNGGSTIDTGVVLPSGQTNSTVVSTIDAMNALFDVDKSGTTDATDGVLILRRLNGGSTIDTGVILPAGQTNNMVVNNIDNVTTAQAAASDIVISGRVAKGTVTNATVRATQLIDGKLSGTQKDAVLGQEGDFSLSMPKGLVHLQVIPQADSTSQDEATGTAVTLPAEFKFRAAIDLADSTASTVNVNITPFSEVGVALAEKSGGLTAENINKSNSGIANILGVDPLGTKPIQSTDTKALANATANEKKLSVLNSAVSHMANTDTLGCGVKAAYGNVLDCTISKLSDQVQLTTANNSVPLVNLGDAGYQALIGGISNGLASSSESIKNTEINIAQEGSASNINPYMFTIDKTIAGSTPSIFIPVLKRQEVINAYKKIINGKEDLIKVANAVYPLATLSNAVYQDAWVNGGVGKTSGYTVLNWSEYNIDPKEANDKDLQWNAFYDDNVIIFAYRGTQSILQDGVITDFIGTLLCQSWPNGQYETARHQFESLIKTKKFHDLYYNKRKIILTGHSLGGGIASYIAINSKYADQIDLVVGFNPAPLCSLNSIVSYSSKIYRIVVEGEFLSTLGLIDKALYNSSPVPVRIIDALFSQSQDSSGTFLYFPGNLISYPKPFGTDLTNGLALHFLDSVLFVLDAAKSLCTSAICPAQPNSAQQILAPFNQSVSLAVSGIQNSYSTEATTYRPAISLTGTHLRAINKISWTCTQPGGTACQGSPHEWTSANWAGKVDIINDSAIKVYPTLLGSNDPAGTYKWSVTFSALNATSITIPFTVTKQQNIPAIPQGVAATYDASNRWNYVTWRGVPGATSYKVYWGTSSGVTKTSESLKVATTTAYGHSGVEVGATYYYRIAAINADGESELSPVVPVNVLTPKVSVLPASGTQGQQFSEPGSGFTKNGKATLYFQYPDGTKTTLKAIISPDGTYSNTWPSSPVCQ
ncbi:MAG: hypothetical protein H7839_12525 [Magnetococcus sp. YQC-5]